MCWMEYTWNWKYPYVVTSTCLMYFSIIFKVLSNLLIVTSDWNIDHRRWSKRCPTLVSPTLKKLWIQKVFTIQCIIRTTLAWDGAWEGTCLVFLPEVRDWSKTCCPAWLACPCWACPTWPCPTWPWVVNCSGLLGCCPSCGYWKEGLNVCASLKKTCE